MSVILYIVIGDFNGGCYGRIMSINPKSTTPYEVKMLK